MNLKLPESLAHPLQTLRPELQPGAPLTAAAAALDEAFQHYQKMLTYEFAALTAEFYRSRAAAEHAATLTHAYRTLESFRQQALALGSMTASPADVIWFNHLFDGLLAGRVHLFPDFKAYPPLAQTSIAH